MDTTTIESPDDELTPELEAQAYTIKPVSPLLRGAFVLMLLVFGGLLSFRLLAAQAEKGTLFPYAIFPLVGVALTLWGSWRIWTRTHRREYAMKRVPLDMSGRKRGVKTVTVIMTLAFIAVWAGQYSTGMLAESWWVVLSALIPYSVYVAFALGIRHQTVPTRAALLVMARDRKASPVPKEWEKHVEALWARWPVRYALGALLFYIAYDVAQNDPMPKNGWVVVLGLSIWAMAVMKEIFVWIIGAAIVGGIGYAIFGAISALPVSVAIVIGALIIANGIKR